MITDTTGTTEACHPTVGQSVDTFGFFVIPAEAGIQRNGVNSVRLDSGFRRNDGKWEQSLFLEVPKNVRLLPGEGHTFQLKQYRV